jgi:hypothetical protein
MGSKTVEMQQTYKVIAAPGDGKAFAYGASIQSIVDSIDLLIKLSTDC